MCKRCEDIFEANHGPESHGVVAQIGEIPDDDALATAVCLAEARASLRLAKRRKAGVAEVSVTTAPRVPAGRREP